MSYTAVWIWASTPNNPDEEHVFMKADEDVMVVHSWMRGLLRNLIVRKIEFSYGPTAETVAPSGSRGSASRATYGGE